MSEFYNQRINNLPKEIGEIENPRYAIVFVHGLGGGRESWANFVQLLQQTYSLKKSYRLFYFHYSSDNWLTDLFWNYPILRFIIRVSCGVGIEKLAKGLDSYINATCYKYEEILLVGHSMGGLVSKQFIVNELKVSKRTCVSKLVTFATPHMGSWLAMLGATEQIRQMYFFRSKFLKLLDDDWYILSAAKHVKPTYMIAEKDWVVSNSSASGMNHEDPENVWASGQDHQSIINPREPDDTAFAYFLKILDEFNNDLVKEEESDQAYNEEDAEEEDA